MRKIPFAKMSGSGNDFIIIDHRRRRIKEADLADFAAKVCRQHLSVGADGLILIESSKRADFKWRFFNSDGSVAAFCGNGARCVARYAHLKKIAGRHLSLETSAGIVQAEVKKDRVRIRFPFVGRAQLHLNVPLADQHLGVHQMNTGVPHVVCYVDKVDQASVLELGRVLRHHPLFQPEGTNVNFVEIEDLHTIRLRTYERGVEDETLACGSGSVAAALITGMLGKGRSPLSVIPRSGRDLRVYFQWDGSVFSEVFLEGEAVLVYEGEMREEAWR